VGRKLIALIDEIINMVVLGIFLLLLLYGSSALLQSSQVYKAADSKEYAMYRPSSVSEDGGISFASLREINPEVFSWLTIFDTNIDYPVARADNNEKYVNTNIMGEYAVSGSLFLDYNHPDDLSDFSNIIYGHHMDKSTMFGEIASFEDEAFFLSHKYGNLFYNGKDHGLELFAFMEVDAYDSSVYRTSIPEGDELAYYRLLLDKSMHSREIDMTENDHIVLLSTCTSDATFGRHIVAAKITDENYKPQEMLEDEAKAQEVISTNVSTKKSVTESSRMRQNCVYVIGILFILILLYILCEWKRKGGCRKKRHEEKE